MIDWIDCKNQMPENRVRVLCAMADGSVEVLSHIPASNGIKYPHQAHWEGRGASYIAFTARDNMVRHWMPIPPRPAAIEER